MEQRFEIKVLGKTIGTASDWDDVDRLFEQYYHFEPADGVPLPACYVITINYETGVVETFTDTVVNSEVDDEYDLFKVLKSAFS